MVEPAKRDTKHRCEIFHCDRRRDRYCYFYCHMKESCKNPCLNGPERCGKSSVKEEQA